MRSKRMYYWIVARGDDGKPYLISAADCHSESDAHQRALEMLSGLDFKIMRFPTMDIHQASAYMRGKRLNSGQGLSRSTQRQGHEKSIARLRRRMSRRDGL